MNVDTHLSFHIFLDCSEIYSLGYRDDGVYRIRLENSLDINIKCNLKEAIYWAAVAKGAESASLEGGWVVIQNRRSESNFDRSWEDYKNGFGNLDSNFWLGNEIIHKLVERTTATDYLFIRHYFADGSTSRYIAAGVRIEDEMSVYEYGFFSARGVGMGDVFVTRDRSNLLDSRCPEIDGGWWYKDYPSCLNSPTNPNSKYSLKNSTSSPGDSVWGFQYYGHFEIGSEVFLFVNSTEN